MLNLVLAIGVINGFILGTLLLLQRGGKSVGNRLFGAIVIGFTLIILQDLIDFNYSFPNLWVIIRNGSDSLVLLILPLLYIYSQILVQSKNGIKGRNLIHLLPFLIFNIFLTPEHLKLLSILIISSVRNIEEIRVAFKVLVSLLYFILIIKTVFSRKILLLKDKLLRLEYKRIIHFKRLIGGFIITGIISLISYIFFTNGLMVNVDSDTITSAMISIVFYLYALVLLKNSIYLNTHQLNTANVYTSPEVLGRLRNKYHFSPLKNKDLEDFANKIKISLEREKLYLNPEVSLLDLEKVTGIKPHYISQSLNTVYKKNFYDLINFHRVEEVKRRIKSENLNQTLLRIAIESGFNSKSSFNRIFKLHTGLTPSEYKKSLQN